MPCETKKDVLDGINNNKRVIIWTIDGGRGCRNQTASTIFEAGVMDLEIGSAG